MVLIAILSLGGLGLIIGAVLGVAAWKFGTQTDEREEKIMNILPGVNCGACGFPGCQAYCSALLKGEANIGICPAGGEEISMKLAEVLGVKVEKAEPKVAVVCCRGGKDRVNEKFIYRGITDCFAASLLQGGFKDCPYGCLGLGSCVKACPFGALSMGKNGLPVVDAKKCTGCGLCLKECPRNIIRIIPRSRKVYAGCVSKDKGKSVRDVCNVGCFACGICAKVSEGAIIMEENLPNFQIFEAGDEKAPMEKIVKAVEKCPVKALILR